MKNFEKFAIVTSLSLFLLRTFTTYGSDGVFFLTMTALAIFYLIFGFFLVNNFTFTGIFNRAAYQSLSTLRILGSACVGFLLGPLVLSTIFLFFNYSGGMNLYFIGVGSTTPLLVISAVKYVLTKDVFYRDNIFRSAFWLAFPTVVLFITNPPAAF
ncbi:hypothetical protein [Chryseolinea lacunae]|uniref:Polysaccharide biosynthesis protein n=1 Tax=Chryseolinea lacunae TaxID=2801331 RepID=A0ABS1KTF9_9BACT|nr:hypothetical protein [Chryseolinea lacunae]MBL0742725.1 hypothetical protein [Chryseolinea lacunae]